MTSVVPIPPSFDSEGFLEIQSTAKYLSFLQAKNVSTVMSTAGTSLFNMLDDKEIRMFNETLYAKFSGKKIIGIPPLSLSSTLKFLDKQIENFPMYDATYTNHNNHHFMFLYPDRFYEEKILIDYFTEISKHLNSRIYIHTMPMRNGRGGEWNYSASLLNELYEQGVLAGIKEEYFNLAAAYNFVLDLSDNIDIIVAGGSMRRFEYLKNAGANSFLAGIGNIFPSIEQDYFEKNINSINLENKFFNVFMKHGWHRSLRIALSLEKLTCHFDRKPWPERLNYIVDDIQNILEEIHNEK